MSGWFRHFRLPPLRWSWSVSVGLRFFLFPCLFRVRPLRARCVGVCLLLPSSFAFPSSRPGYVTFISSSLSSHFHPPFILIFISFLRAPRRQGVCVCACVRAWVRACVRGWVGGCVCVCFFPTPTTIPAVGRRALS